MKSQPTIMLAIALTATMHCCIAEAQTKLTLRIKAEIVVPIDQVQPFRDVAGFMVYRGDSLLGDSHCADSTDDNGHTECKVTCSPGVNMRIAVRPPSPATYTKVRQYIEPEPLKYLITGCTPDSTVRRSIRFIHPSQAAIVRFKSAAPAVYAQIVTQEKNADGSKSAWRFLPAEKGSQRLATVLQKPDGLQQLAEFRENAALFAERDIDESQSYGLLQKDQAVQYTIAATDLIFRDAAARVKIGPISDSIRSIPPALNREQLLASLTRIDASISDKSAILTSRREDADALRFDIGNITTSGLRPGQFRAMKSGALPRTIAAEPWLLPANEASSKTGVVSDYDKGKSMEQQQGLPCGSIVTRRPGDECPKF